MLLAHLFIDSLTNWQIHVVNEKRFYSSSSDLKKEKNQGLDYGIIKAKKALNELHFELGSAGYSQVIITIENK